MSLSPSKLEKGFGSFWGNFLVIRLINLNMPSAESLFLLRVS